MDNDFLKVILESPLSLSSATIVSEDLAYIYGLFGVQSQHISAVTFVLFFSFGVLVGDLMLYFVGRYVKYFLKNSLGQKLERFINKYAKQDHSEEQFGRFEEFLVFTRFIPGTRLPTYLLCGHSGYPLLKFTLILTVTCLFYSLFGVILILATSYSIEKEMSLIVRIGISVLIATISISTFKLFISLRRSKLQYGEILTPLWIKFSRLRFLEFWPPLFLYLPFVPYFLYNHIRYGGIKSLLSSNPAIKMSGLIGEQKSEIDLLLKNYTPDHRLKSYLLDVGSSHEDILNEISFPLILKPDSGMRGQDVQLIRTKNEFLKKIQGSKSQLIAQELCPFPNEWGVFYIRYPDSTEGSIFSLTKKVLPIVEGDGKEHLYQLIKRMPRFYHRFDLVFRNSNYKPLEISEKGKHYQLINEGSHSKGCLFLNENISEYKTAADQIARVLDKIPNFCIGRVDIKFANHAELAKGHFKIIEINGSGGESTNIYDSKISKLKVYSILQSQWKHIYKIGRMNRKQNKETKLSLKDLFSEMIKYRNQGKK